ncbi:urease accessory protein UreD [Nocardioides sp. zg-1228]|uniref:urease accessory protein UreD n=1 Tax=Nocardioides sp. zg-1228 TaxID=2763008 RepID=UPI0016429A48|nr:urease accessory protein UreD [Nocardioides sp. zg-1228]MBC2933080.1 urease accessory protein UreD [Nocardioides sp. zg-1228]QSF56730.1 urease accessory protein UreD [Nocardioides sp. zg-1228]
MTTSLLRERDPVPSSTVPVPTTRYGGPRLDPAYYEPDRVPDIIERYAGPIDTLPPGSPGKVGLLELEFGRTPRGTELVQHYQKAPLQIMRPLYYDPARPDMPYTYLMSTGAGVMQGDRLRTDLVFGPGTSAHVTTSAWTKVLRMHHDYAVAQVNISVGEDAFLEYLPDPVILFAEARLYQRTRLTLPPSASVVVGETLVAGRLAHHDERHLYSALAADFEVCRPDGTVVALDRVRLTPADGATGDLAVLDDHDVLSMLYVLTSQASVAEVTELLHSALAPSTTGGVIFGVSALPDDAGVWVRLLGDDTRSVGAAMTLAWQSVRRLLTGGTAPTIRKT